MTNENGLDDDIDSAEVLSGRQIARRIEMLVNATLSLIDCDALKPSAGPMRQADMLGRSMPRHRNGLLRIPCLLTPSDAAGRISRKVSTYTLASRRHKNCTLRGRR